MELRKFWFDLEPGGRTDFAQNVGSSVGHLTNVAYGYRPCSPVLCVQIEAAASGAVMRWELRPDDWHLIWPELIDTAGAPTIPAQGRPE